MAAQTFNMALEANFRKRVEKQINDLGRQVSQGLMAPDQYKFTCGIIKGLSNSLELIEDAEKELNTAERGENG